MAFFQVSDLFWLLVWPPECDDLEKPVQKWIGSIGTLACETLEFTSNLSRSLYNKAKFASVALVSFILMFCSMWRDTSV